MNPLLPKKLFPFILHFMKPYRGAFAVFLTVPMLLLIESSIQPYAIKMLIDGLSNADPSKSLVPPIVWTGIIIYMVSYLIIMVGFRFREWLASHILPRFLADIRMSVMDQLSTQTYQYFTNNLAGRLSNKVSDLPTAINDIHMIMCWNIIGPFAVALCSLIMIGMVSPLSSAILLGWLVVHLSVAFAASKYINAYSKQNAEDKSQLSGLIVDFLTNMISVKLFARRSFEMALIQKTQDIECVSLHQTMKAVNILRIFMDAWSAMMVFSIFMTLVYAWKHALLSPGDIVFVMMSMIACLYQLWFSGHMIADLFKHIGIAQQALDVLAEPIRVQEIPHAKTLEVPQGKIVFDNVAFEYHQDRLIFSNKNVTIEAGSKVGLVGFSGSGKTTFVHLILRFYDVTAGRILIDDQNIAEVTQDSLHENIAMVPQDISLFHRTLFENIKYGAPDADEAAVIQASKAAHCHEFIEALPQGYQTLVGERGLKLSGGQRQRIAIARAMLKKAPILILDEATSALDSQTEQYIQESLHTLMAQRTTIVVAHRLSTLANMDRILVFDNGQIVEDGTHEVLMAQKGHYAHLWKMQAGGFLTG